MTLKHTDLRPFGVDMRKRNAVFGRVGVDDGSRQNTHKRLLLQAKLQKHGQVKLTGKRFKDENVNGRIIKFLIIYLA